VFFNDEIKINHFNFNGLNWFWISEKKNFPIQVVKQTMKRGGCSIDALKLYDNK